MDPSFNTYHVRATAKEVARDLRNFTEFTEFTQFPVRDVALSLNNVQHVQSQLKIDVNIRDVEDAIEAVYNHKMLHSQVDNPTLTSSAVYVLVQEVNEAALHMLQQRVAAKNSIDLFRERDRYAFATYNLRQDNPNGIGYQQRRLPYDDMLDKYMIAEY